MVATASERRSLSSVTNALAVLEYLVEADEAGVSEIARHVGVTVGTAHRLVGTLVATGFAEQNPLNRKYLPSQKLVALAQRARRSIDAREIAHRHLLALVGAVHETGNLAILSNNMVLYTDKVTSDQPFGVEARVGSHLPAYCTALGKILIAGLTDGEVDRYLKGARSTRGRKDMPKPPTEASFRAQIKRARAEGFAVDNGEYLPDVFCAAAPIRNAQDAVVAALSVSAPRSRFEANKDRFVTEVQRAATELSGSLATLGLPRTPQEFAPTELR